MQKQVRVLRCDLLGCPGGPYTWDQGPRKRNERRGSRTGAHGGWRQRMEGRGHRPTDAGIPRGRRSRKDPPPRALTGSTAPHLDFRPVAPRVGGGCPCPLLWPPQATASMSLCVTHSGETGRAWEAVPTPGHEEGSSQALLPVLPQRVSGQRVSRGSGTTRRGWHSTTCDPQVRSVQLRGLGQARAPLGPCVPSMWVRATVFSHLGCHGDPVGNTGWGD